MDGNDERVSGNTEEAHSQQPVKPPGRDEDHPDIELGHPDAIHPSSELEAPTHPDDAASDTQTEDTSQEGLWSRITDSLSWGSESEPADNTDGAGEANEDDHEDSSRQEDISDQDDTTSSAQPKGTDVEEEAVDDELLEIARSAVKQGLDKGQARHLFQEHGVSTDAFDALYEEAKTSLEEGTSQEDTAEESDPPGPVDDTTKTSGEDVAEQPEESEAQGRPLPDDEQDESKPEQVATDHSDEAEEKSEGWLDTASLWASEEDEEESEENDDTVGIAEDIEQEARDETRSEDDSATRFSHPETSSDEEEASSSDEDHSEWSAVPKDELESLAEEAIDKGMEEDQVISLFQKHGIKEQLATRVVDVVRGNQSEDDQGEPGVIDEDDTEDGEDADASEEASQTAAEHPVEEDTSEDEDDERSGTVNVLRELAKRGMREGMDHSELISLFEQHGVEESIAERVLSDIQGEGSSGVVSVDPSAEESMSGEAKAGIDVQRETTFTQDDDEDQSSFLSDVDKDKESLQVGRIYLTGSRPEYTDMVVEGLDDILIDEDEEGESSDNDGFIELTSEDDDTTHTGDDELVDDLDPDENIEHHVEQRKKQARAIEEQASESEA